ncbi:MAG: RAMP superfamily CRISPR-associated protein, partial [Candidatus Dadabacteria bacterium]|nr:RAMP superfamily CRISPR-associated protein [Candidatus Dadabacteria bacterium]
MKLPLYCGRQPMQYRDAKGHAGLWFDKFCDRWIGDDIDWRMTSDKQEQQPKQEWIKTVTDREVGDESQIEEYAIRLVRLIRAKKGRSEVFITDKESRFVTGLGRSHPVENGFAWHASLGVPFLPGSSVKGMIRSWAIANASRQIDETTLNRVLGEPGRLGEVHFLDAVPL